MAFPHRPSTFLRYLVPALLLTLTLYLLSDPHHLRSRIGPLILAVPWGHERGASRHPINALVKAADKEFASQLAKATETLPDAAAAYRKRRGRHPPPGFDKWHAFAQEKNALIVEDFWDQIYHDLEPFWGVKPAQIRKDAREFEMRIEVRDHKASTGSGWFWTKIWLDMIQTVEHLLPDMDLAMNAMDEPRMVVPWEDINAYMKKAAKTRKIVDVKKVVSDFGKLPPLGAPIQEAPSAETPPVTWERDSKLTFLLLLVFSPATSETALTESARRALLAHRPARVRTQQRGPPRRDHHRLRQDPRHRQPVPPRAHVRRLRGQLHAQHRFLPPARPASARGHLCRAAYVMPNPPTPLTPSLELS